MEGGVAVIVVSELKRWLDTLSPTDAVGVDEGGLALVSCDDPEVYLEVGGYLAEADKGDE